MGWTQLALSAITEAYAKLMILYIYPSIFVELHANMGKCKLGMELFGLGDQALNLILLQDNLEERLYTWIINFTQEATIMLNL